MNPSKSAVSILDADSFRQAQLRIVVARLEYKKSQNSASFRISSPSFVVIRKSSVFLADQTSILFNQLDEYLKRVYKMRSGEASQLDAYIYNTVKAHFSVYSEPVIDDPDLYSE